MDQRLIRGFGEVVFLMWVLAISTGTRAQTGGTPWAWGSNEYGQLGNGTKIDSSVPVPVPSMAIIASASGGALHSLAVRNDGTLWTWGYNFDGELGNGTHVEGDLPAPVPGLSGVVAAAGGGAHSLALMSDGTVRAWGDNLEGELGDGTFVERDSPVQVSGLTDVIAVAGGYFHSLALKRDGTVWTWGRQYPGGFAGTGSGAVNLPVQVPTLTSIKAIAGGEDWSLVLKSDGSVWAWGSNQYGELGNGGNIASAVPVLVSNLSDIVAIAAGASHGLALGSDGTVWGWGYNESGQLGDGTYLNGNMPARVSGLSNISAIAAGVASSLALTDVGQAWAWGANQNGQLGTGMAISDSNVPLQVVGLTGMTAIACGAIHSFAFVAGCPELGFLPGGPLPNGTVGLSYSQEILAFGGTGPYRYALTACSLPQGLALSGDGVLSGTPSSPGIFEVVVTAADAKGCAGTGSYALTVTMPPPVVSGMAKMGSPFRIVANGGNLQPGLKVFINGSSTEWSLVTWKSSSKVVIKGGAALKSTVPKGVPASFTFLNPDGGTSTVTGWSW